MVDVVAAATSTPNLRDYAGVVIAASVHGGRYQKPVQQWVAGHADELRSMPTAFVSVSLGVLQKDPKVQPQVAAILDRFLMASGWTPTMVTSVAGALVSRRYNWIKRSIMRRIARAAGGDTDVSKDYEYTDWKQVEALARGVQSARPSLAGPAPMLPEPIAYSRHTEERCGRTVGHRLVSRGDRKSRPENQPGTRRCPLRQKTPAPRFPESPLVVC